MDLVIQHHWRDRLSISDQIRSDYHYGDPRWAHILLRSGVDHSEFTHVHRLGAEIRRHVSYEKGVFAGGLRVILKFDAVNGFISTDMQVFGAGGLFNGVVSGDFGVFLGLSGPDAFGIAVFGGFFEGLVPPRSGDDVIDHVVGLAEIERDGGELGGGAALEEEDGVI